MAYILRLIYIYMADILWWIYYGDDTTADTLRQRYHGKCMMEGTLRKYMTGVVLRPTKTAISQQIYSASSSQMLHPNLFVATHRSSEPR